MPSTAYSAEFRPDSRLRVLVLGCGALSLFIGLFVISTLGFPAWATAAGGAAWSAAAIAQLERLSRSWSACRRLRFLPGGEIAVRGPDGTWRRAALAPGGILLRRWAWIRYRTASGRAAAELLRGSCRESHDWRRLQVIWRHIGAPVASC